MERLTNKAWRNFDPWECCGQDKYCQRGCHDPGGCTKGCIVPQLYARLGDYEDTGLTPQEVISMKFEWCAMMDALNSIGGGYTRLRELAEADRDGRLVVRPYSIGETVYVLLKDGAIFYPETNGWYISEEIIEAISHDGFYLGDPVDDVYTPDSEIGKTVFLTKKAAKAALEAMKDG